MTRTLIALALLALPACAEQRQAVCPTAERGAWVVAWEDAYAMNGKPGLVIADICDEQSSDTANERVCRDRADQFNRELAEQGERPIYFPMWEEE